MVREVLRSRDGFGSRSACRTDGSFFFFSFFFSFRVNDERETTTGTTALMHFESRCGERDRVSSAPSEGWMRRVYAGRKCSIRCVYVYISRISLDQSIVWVWRRKEDVRQRSVTRRGGQILVHFYDTSAFFFYESSVFCFSITHQIIRKRNRLVSMPPVKPPSYTNLSSGKS